MKDETLIKILIDLLANKKMTSAKIAEKYDISKRTVFRYIDTLSLANVPIVSSYGRNGGFYIPDTYKIPTSFFTEQEFNSVLSVLTGVNKELCDKTLESGISKIQVAKKGNQNLLNVTDGNLIIDAGPWGGGNIYREKLAVIQKAINLCSMLEIRYHDREGDVTQREIEPHSLVFKQGLWYTYAFCHLREEFRLFKIGRIEFATMLNKTFTRRILPDNALDEWYSSVENQEVFLSIDKSVLSDVEEWLGIENVYENNGEFFARASLPFDDGLVSKILTFGAGVFVKEPAILKDKIISATKKIVTLYENL